MQAYDIKRGHKSNIEGDKLKNIMIDIFESVKEDGDNLIASYGAMKKVFVKIDNKEMFIETEMDKNVDEETAIKTIKAYNNFLLLATGFTSKERKKRLNKKAKDGKL